MSAHSDVLKLASTCFCGGGRIFVTWDSENYPPFRQSFFPSVECPECARKYCLAVHSLEDVRVSERCDWAARNAAVIKHNATWDADPDVLALCARLRQRLDSLPSLAAKHRWLRDRNLTDGGLTSFRKYYQVDPDRVVKSIITMRAEWFPALAAARQRRDAIAIPEVQVYPVRGIAWVSVPEV